MTNADTANDDKQFNSTDTVEQGDALGYAAAQAGADWISNPYVIAHNPEAYRGWQQGYKRFKDSAPKFTERSRWMLTADSKAVASAIRQTGVVALMGGGLTERETQGLAARVISSLDKENLSLATFMLIGRDDSYESVTIRIEPNSAESHMSAVMLQRVVTYDTLGGLMEPREEVRNGPLVPRSLASTLIELINKHHADEIASWKAERG